MKVYPRIDYKQRPSSYWNDETLEQAILKNIKGDFAALESTWTNMRERIPYKGMLACSVSSRAGLDRLGNIRANSMRWLSHAVGTTCAEISGSSWRKMRDLLWSAPLPPAGLLGQRRGRQSAQEGPEGVEHFVFEEEVAVDGIVFDHLFDRFPCLGNVTDLAEQLHNTPIPVGAEFVQRIGKTFFGLVEDFECRERSMLHIDFEFQGLPVALAVGLGLHDPFGPEAGLRSVQRLGPRGDDESLVDELPVIVEVVGQLHEEVPSLEVFAFAVEAAALENGAFHLDGRAAAAADAVQIGRQFPWPGDHERKKQLLAGGLCRCGHRLHSYFRKTVV